LLRLRRASGVRAALAQRGIRNQPACKSRRLQLLPELGIGGGPPQQPRILVELAEAGIALAAEQKAQPVRGMVMIDAELGGRPSLADRATAVLRGRQQVVVGLGQAVVAPELVLGVRGLVVLVVTVAARPLSLPILRILGITLPFGGERPFPELVVLGISLAVGRERLLPVFRILGITLALQVFVLCHLLSSICAR
jgi:hypothetical protein